MNEMSGRPTKSRSSSERWCSNCEDLSHCITCTATTHERHRHQYINSWTFESTYHWNDSSVQAGAGKERITTTTIGLEPVEGASAASWSTVTANESTNSSCSDLITSNVSSIVSTAASSPPTTSNGRTRVEISSLLSATSISIILPPSSNTQTPVLQAAPPPTPPETSEPVSKAQPTTAQVSDDSLSRPQASLPDSAKPPPCEALNTTPPVSEVSSPKPTSIITTPSSDPNMAPSLVTPIGSPMASPSPTPGSPVPTKTTIDMTSTPHKTSAELPTTFSISDLAEYCKANFWDPSCNTSARTTGTGGAGTTTADGVATTTMYMATVTTSASPTCNGNSETCYCINGSCTLRSTFAVVTKTGVLVYPSDSATVTITAPPTSANSSAQNTSTPFPTSTTPHKPVNVLPIALAVCIPIAIILFVLAVEWIWRRVHRRSYNVYTAYCPFHNTGRGITATLARWKLTRQRNAMLRARTSSGLGDALVDGEKTPTSPLAGFDLTKPIRDGDVAQTPLAKWRRAEENRLKAVQNKHDAEQGAQEAENLRRYEIERARRARDFGVSGLPPAAASEDWAKFDQKHGRKTPPPTSKAAWSAKGKEGVVKSDAWTIHKGRGEGGRRPTWEAEWRALGSDRVRTPTERMRSPTIGSEEDAILPTSPSTTLRGSESVGRGSGSERWI